MHELSTNVLRDILDNVVDYAVGFSADDLKCTYINRTFAIRLGVSAREIVGTHMRDVFGKQGYETFLEHAKKHGFGSDAFFANCLRLGIGSLEVALKLMPALLASGELGSVVLVGSEPGKSKSSAVSIFQQIPSRLESLTSIASYQNHDMIGLLDLALSEARRNFTAEDGYIYFFDESKRKIELCQCSAALDKHRLYRLVGADVGHVYKTDADGKVGLMTAPDGSKLAMAAGDQLLQVAQEVLGCSRLNALRVLVDDHVMAVISLTGMAGDYGEDDINHLALLLSFVWNNVERQRSEEYLQRALRDARARTNEVEALLAGSKVVLSYRDFGGAARKVFDTCKLLLGATAGYVALRSEDGDSNEVLFLETGGKACSVDPTLPMPIRGLREKAYRLQETVWENDFANSPWQRFMPPGHLPLKSVLFAPLIIEGKAVGVIGLANKPGGFDKNDARLAVAFGEIAAVALRNSRLIETMEASEGRFRNLYENMSDGVAVCKAVDQGRDFVIRDLNKAGERICRVSTQDVIGRSVSEAFPGVREMGLFSVFQEVWQSGEPKTLATGLSRDKNLTLWVENYIYKLPSGEVVAIFDDVTAAKQAEAERQRMESLLRQAQKMEAVGTLAGGIAHDFNNILGAVIGYSELALGLAQNKRENTREIGGILKASERAKELVRQILTFSRKMDVDLSPLDLNLVVRSAVGLLSSTITKMISIHTRLAVDLKPIMANANQIEQILLNLATNAQDAMPDGGTLSIETRNVTLDLEFCAHHLAISPGPYVLLRVADTGLGMDETTKEHIFEPFFTTKEVGKGTGLGLSTVYGIVNSQGGHILCQSQPNTGTTFNLYFPQPRRESRISAPLPDHPEQVPGGYETILLADDEEELREIGSRILREAGYRVLTANSGEEALTIYSELGDSLHLVILDLGMPGIGGHKALKAMLAVNPKFKVIIASGYAANSQVKKAMDTGAVGYLAKPFLQDEMLSTVRSVLNKS